jgi:formate/nitrite transporter FocA (FNT family)
MMFIRQFNIKEVNMTKSGFLAGTFVSLGAVAYIMTSRPAIFSIGIILCILFAPELYTRVVPLTAKKFYTVKDCAVSLLLNAAGGIFCGILIALTRLPIADKIKSSVESRLNDSFVSLFILAIGCGVFIALGTLAYLKFRESNIILAFALVAVCITAFVCSGFEHIIADTFYMSYYSVRFGFSLNMLKVFAAVTAGNTVGGFVTGVIVGDK